MHRTTLDPIVSLSVALAEGPGSFAFFLGSGASRDAGVPTGAEVRLQAMSELYRLDNGTEETPPPGQLEEWFAGSGHGAMTYSQILETLMPDAAVRRAYLAKHFGGRAPGDTHRRLATLAADGIVRVFITTNFDRLLEHALQAQGIEPVVVTSDAELERAPAREHVECFVLKPHGDYLQETIRNTEAELAELESGVTEELHAIVDRYGVVVTGYAGADEAIGRVLRARRGRYGLYWVSRAAPSGPAQALVEASGGRVILRDSSAEFLADLERRLAVYRSHPSGLTPPTVNAEVIALLRAGDRIGLREALKAERRAVLDMARDIVAEYQSVSSPSEEQAEDVATRVLGATDRYRAALLPLIEHDPEAFAGEVEGIAQLAGTRFIDSGLTGWIEFPYWPAWLLVNSCGAFAVDAGNLIVVAQLLREPLPGPQGTSASLGLLDPGEAARVISAIVVQRAGIMNRAAPWYDVLVRSLGESELLQERYPEIADGGEATMRAVNDFGLLRTLYAGLTNAGTTAEWAMFWEGGQRIARRLREDQRYRARVATEVFDMETNAFEQQAGEALRAGLAGAVPGGSVNTGVELDLVPRQ